MAGQGPSRRELLQALGLASAASAFAGFSRWSYGLAETAPQQQHSFPPRHRGRSVYRPQFFSPEQYRCIEVLADLILPAVHDAAPAGSAAAVPRLRPGAREAGVSEFIDFMAFSDATLQKPFRDGLQWLDHASTPAASFAGLAPEKQNSILERLAYKAKYRDEEEDGQKFFQLFRRYTVMGFYTTRIGLEALDYPGLTFYGTSPGCTHDGNPGHVGL